MIHCTNKSLNVLYYILALHCVRSVLCSEFPERECCDTVYSAIPNPEPAPTSPTLLTHIIPSTITANHTGSNAKGIVSILSCILARQLCFEDPSCAAILEIIPRVCGTVPVACSTVTVTKCLAALKTLQAFPFFRPTCLCKEPGIDPECNNFRDFLFDHPCGLVSKREKDPYPIEALPTCNHALTVCQQEPKCFDLFENFKTHCKVRENKCRMDDRNLCHEAWSNLRLSPMFGCICSNNHMKRRCDRIFSMVNHNPCIAHSHNHYLDEFNDEFVNRHKLNDGDRKRTSHSSNTFLYPYNLTMFQISPTMDNIPINIGPEMDKQETFPDAMPKPIPDFHQIQHSQLMCDEVFRHCKEDPHCAVPLQAVLAFCEVHTCNRNACLDALQKFYKVTNEDIGLDVAFCTCKKTGGHRDTCTRAQEKLHPSCAQRPDLGDLPISNSVSYTSALPGCHVNAEFCREDPNCRHRLEHYEQACAVDSSTMKCAGRPSNCRTAIIGILGTPLKVSCSCQGPSESHYDCVGWQRLLWSNTCVAESHYDFHAKRSEEISVIMASKPSTNMISFTTATIPTTRQSKLPRKITLTTTFKHFGNDIQTTTIPTTTTTLATLAPQAEVQLIEKIDENMSIEVTTKVHSTTLTVNDITETETVTSTIVVTEPPTTPEPRSCVVQRPHQSDQRILADNARRIYSLDDAECSEICFCSSNLALTCHALCVPFKPCRTALAFYSHASPAYQAFRGRCLCYSGNFICMRPQPGEYTLPGGIFLFLGYSSKDEALLNNFTNLAVTDAIKPFQQYLRKYIDNQTSCILSFFNKTDENIIISARLPDEPNVDPVKLFDKEKAQCVSVLEQLSYHINSQETELAAHQLLSIYKMAEVHIVSPQISSSIKTRLSLPLVISAVTIVFSLSISNSWVAFQSFSVSLV